MIRYNILIDTLPDGMVVFRGVNLDPTSGTPDERRLAALLDAAHAAAGEVLIEHFKNGTMLSKDDIQGAIKEKLQGPSR